MPQKSIIIPRVPLQNPTNNIQQSFPKNEIAFDYRKLVPLPPPSLPSSENCGGRHCGRATNSLASIGKTMTNAFPLPRAPISHPRRGCARGREHGRARRQAEMRANTVGCNARDRVAVLSRRFPAPVVHGLVSRARGQVYARVYIERKFRPFLSFIFSTTGAPRIFFVEEGILASRSCTYVRYVYIYRERIRG